MEIQFNAYSSVVDVYNFIYGDVNDDDVDTIDSALLARFIGKWANININSQAADVNNDSRINTVDSAILKRHIANWTGYEELPYLPSASLMALNSQKGKVTADSVVANAGDEVSVGVALSDNPGIISMKLDVDYDLDALELVDVIDNGIIPGQTHSDDLTTIPYTLYWDNGDSADNYNANGNLVNLIFRVKDSAKVGEYPISLSYDAENSDIIDSSLNAVQFDIQSGSVNIVELNIKINDVTDICGCSFNVVYDNNALPFQKYETGELFDNSSVMVNEKYSDNTIRLVSAGTEEFVQTGNLLKAVFSIKDTTAQNTTISIEEIKLSDGDGNKKLVEDIACDLQMTEETTQTSSHRKGGDLNTNIATVTTDNNLIVGHLANFKDVLTSDWFYSYVCYVYENKWMQGLTNTEFAPNNNVTRAMFVTVLYRIADEPEFVNEIAFSDVETGSYYEKAVLWANVHKSGFTQL